MHRDLVIQASQGRVLRSEGEIRSPLVVRFIIPLAGLLSAISARLYDMGAKESQVDDRITIRSRQVYDASTLYSDEESLCHSERCAGLLEDELLVASGNGCEPLVNVLIERQPWTQSNQHNISVTLLIAVAVLSLVTLSLAFGSKHF